MRRFSRELGKEVEGISPEVLELLQRYPWDGNVRELQSVLKQAIIQGIGPVLGPECLPAALCVEVAATTLMEVPDLEEALTRFVAGRLQLNPTRLHEDVVALVERHLILHVLRHTGGNQSQTARILGMTRKTLRTKLEYLHISVAHSTEVEE